MNEISIIKLDADYPFKPFDCGNQDLNDFLLIDSKNYQKKLLSVTYILETDKDIVAFFSVSNDKISIPDSDKATIVRVVYLSQLMHYVRLSLSIKKTALIF